jgi:galactokinase
VKTILDRLVAAGLSATEAESKLRLLRRAEVEVEARADGEVARWFVPGRIEVLGKHTDYAGGRSLLCAVERGMCVAAAPRSDSVLRITDAGIGDSAEFDLGLDLQVPASGWTLYPATVARRLARNFGKLRGVEIAFASDLPRSAGMSSSSLLVVATFAAICSINSLSERAEYAANIGTQEELAGYLGAIENGSSFGALAGDAGVGTFGGSQDHTAILRSEPGKLVQYRFCPVEREGTIPLPENCVFLIASSGVAARKSGSARELYNRTSGAATAVLRAWRAATGRDDASLFAAATSSADAPERLREIAAHASSGEFGDGVLRARCQQFLEETFHIIPAAADALTRGDLRAFGEAVERSQQGAENLLGNQVPETIALARAARELGAYATSAFGAGFGGSVWALVERAHRVAFLERWQTMYRRRFPAAAERSRFFATNAGPPLMEL